MERTLEASVWPYLQIESGNYDSDSDALELYFDMANPGLGPARVESFEVLLDGEPVGWTVEALAACCAPSGEDAASRREALIALTRAERLMLITGSQSGVVLQPGARSRFFSFERPQDDPEAEAVWDALNDARFDRLDMVVCYCSMFDECWTTRLRVRRPERVRACPVAEE
jgi:hypothetical protein